MSEQRVKCEMDGEVAVVTLSNPGAMNAIGGDMAGELAAIVRKLSAKDSGARALVLTGEGRGFCAGADLQAVGRGPTPPGVEPDVGASLETVFNPLMTSLRDCPIAIVTAVNGAAAGVGCSLALMGDMVLAAEGAYFLQAFRRVGLVPDGGATYLLPRLIGKARAMEMMLQGDKVPAAQVLDWGMINRVVPGPDLMAAALDVARGLANGPWSIGQIRRLVWESLDADWAGQLGAERQAQKLAGRTEDFREGVKAFLEKRPAHFNGR